MNRTCLYDLHIRLGAKMVEFGGWEMPLMYTGIIEEHLATRSDCTMFDISHMGRVYVSGGEATNFLENLCTRRIGDMQAGQARYSHMCRPDGGILDDLIVSRLDAERYLVVCNASNREKICNWLRQHAAGRNVQIDDQTISTAMIAVQGPATLALADEVLPFAVSDIKRYRFRTGKYMGVDYICSRTGYTGEDGFEIIVSRAAGKLLAENIVDSDSSVRGRVRPAGLGARDTLRLEAAMPLYGHELTEEVDSISAGQGWCVNLDKDFIGRSALQQVQEQGPRRKLVGLEVEGKRIARQDAPLHKDGRPVGVVTSGTLSPTLQKVIALGYVDAECSATGTELEANIRDKMTKARVAPPPFYKRSSK